MTAVEARIEGKLNSVRDELREAVLDAESRLLSAIYGYTETISTRMDGTAKRMAEFEERLTIAERRLLELEKRLLMPPQ